MIKLKKNWDIANEDKRVIQKYANAQISLRVAIHQVELNNDCEITEQEFLRLLYMIGEEKALKEYEQISSINI